eukprot:Em0023g98a
MEKPPAPSDKDKKLAKELKARQQKEEADQMKKIEKFRTDVTKEVGQFLSTDQRRLDFPPMGKVYRAIIHELAEANGLSAYAFTVEGEDEKRMVLFKKDHPPSELELQAIKRGEEYDPTKSVENVQTEPLVVERHVEDKGEEPAINYHDKYKHIIGDTCAVKSAIKMEPNKVFGYVPSANKRDLRSIEQTLNDMRHRKKQKLESNESAS